MGMKTGFNLLLWTTHVGDEHLPLLAKLKATGYDGVEIPLFEGDVGHFRQARAGDRGTMVSPARRSPCCPTRRTARSAPMPAAARARSTTSNGRSNARPCSAARCCAGRSTSRSRCSPAAGPSEDEKARAAEVHRAAAEIAAAAGLVLAIEPLNRFECYFLNTMADAKAYVQRVGHPSFGALYDTFHANIEEQDPVGVIARRADVIRHVHVSENDRGTPGKGHVPWAATFKALRAAGYDGWLTIEAFGTALPALAAATKVWRDFFPSREEVYEHGLKTIRDGWSAAG